MCYARQKNYIDVLRLNQVFKTYALPGQKKQDFWRQVLMGAIDTFDRERGGIAREVLRLKSATPAKCSNAKQ